MTRITCWQAALLPFILTQCAWSGTVGGELGATLIGETLYWVVRFQPELVVGDFGLGFDAELLWDREGVRDDDWARSHKWVRLIRFVRWGAPGDHLRGRLGALDDVTLGHGLVVRHYTNWYDEDYRRLGVHACGHATAFGGEAFSSSVGRWELVGARLWAEPLRAIVPSPRNLRLGMSAFIDLDPDASKATDDRISIWATDLEFPLIVAPPATVFLYLDGATIGGHGHGVAAGVSASPGRLAGISELRLRLERRFLGSRFIPDYVDAFYGVERYDQETGQGKEALLDLQTRCDGWYSELSGLMMDAVEITAGFSRIQTRQGSGVLHIDIHSRPLRQRWEVSVSLNKTGIETLGDLSRRGRALADVRVGYQITPWSLVYLRLRRTFQRQEVGYQQADVIVPRISMSVSF